MRARRADLAERILGGPVLWVGLVLLTLFAVAPFVWVLLSSFKTRQELYATPLVYMPASFSFVRTMRGTSAPWPVSWRTLDCGNSCSFNHSRITSARKPVDSRRMVRRF